MAFTYTHTQNEDEKKSSVKILFYLFYKAFQKYPNWAT